MNRLLTTGNGGFPVALDDIRWQAKGLHQALAGLLSAFGDGVTNNFIVTGCVSGGGYCSSGWICLGGELLWWPGGVIPTPAGGQAVYWQEVTTFDATGLKVFENLASVNTYEIRQAVLVALTINPALMPLAAVNIFPALQSWTDLVFGSGPINLAGSVTVVGAAGEFRYIILGKTIHLNFTIEAIFTGTPTPGAPLIVTLPVGWNVKRLAGVTSQVLALVAGNLSDSNMYKVISDSAVGDNFLCFQAVGASSFPLTSYATGVITFELQ